MGQNLYPGEGLGEEVPGTFAFDPPYGQPFVTRTLQAASLSRFQRSEVGRKAWEVLGWDTADSILLAMRPGKRFQIPFGRSQHEATLQFCSYNGLAGC